MGLSTPKRLRHSEPAKNKSPIQERSIAQRLNAKTTKASGSQDEKGDVRLKGVIRLEAKCTRKDSFRVTKDMLRKIEEAALASGELPVIEVEFINDKAETLYTCSILPTYAFDTLVTSYAAQ